MKRYFVIGTAWTSAAAWVEQIFNLAIFVLIARLIGTEEFGLATMSLAFVLLGEVLVRETLSEGIIERRKIEEGFLEATFAALVGFGLIIFLALSAFSQFAATIYGAPAVAGLMLATAPTVILIAGSAVSTAILRRNMSFRLLAIRSIAGVIAGGVVGIYLAVEGYGAWSLVGQRLALILVTSLVAIFAAQWWPKRLPKRSEFTLIGGLGPRIVLLRATTIAMLQSPTVALGIAIGPQAVALFAITWRLVEVILSLIVGPIKSVAQSTIAVIRRDNSTTDDFFLDLTQIVALIGFTAFAGLALVGDPAVEFVFGSDWSGTVPLLPWICLVGAIQALTEFQESYLMAHDRTRKYVKAVILEAITCILFVALASTYGVVFAAAAFALRAVLFFPIRTKITLAPETISATRYTQTLMAPAMIALGMVIAVALWRSALFGQIPDLLYLVSAVIVGVLTFSIILAFMTPNVLMRLMSFVNSARQNE